MLALYPIRAATFFSNLQMVSLHLEWWTSHLFIRLGESGPASTIQIIHWAIIIHYSWTSVVYAVFEWYCIAMVIYYHVVTLNNLSVLMLVQSFRTNNATENQGCILVQTFPLMKQFFNWNINGSAWIWTPRPWALPKASDYDALDHSATTAR